MPQSSHEIAVSTPFDPDRGSFGEHQQQIEQGRDLSHGLADCAPLTTRHLCKGIPAELRLLSAGHKMPEDAT